MTWSNVADHLSSTMPTPVALLTFWDMIIAMTPSATTHLTSFREIGEDGFRIGNLGEVDDDFDG